MPTDQHMIKYEIIKRMCERLPPGPFSSSLVPSQKQPMENPPGNVGLDSGAFLLTTELFERANQNCSMSNYSGGPLVH